MSETDTSSDMQHVKVTTHTPDADGNGKTITTSSYYEQLSHEVLEFEKHIKTSKNGLLKDLLSCLEAITKEGSPELNLRIKAQYGEPVSITKRWVVSKKKHARR